MTNSKKRKIQLKQLNILLSKFIEAHGNVKQLSIIWFTKRSRWQTLTLSWNTFHDLASWLMIMKRKFLWINITRLENLKKQFFHVKKCSLLTLSLSFFVDNWIFLQIVTWFFRHITTNGDVTFYVKFVHDICYHAHQSRRNGWSILYSTSSKIQEFSEHLLLLYWFQLHHGNIVPAPVMIFSGSLHLL